MYNPLQRRFLLEVFALLLISKYLSTIFSKLQSSSVEFRNKHSKQILILACRVNILFLVLTTKYNPAVAESFTDSVLAGLQTEEDCIFPFLKIYLTFQQSGNLRSNQQFTIFYSRCTIPFTIQPFLLDLNLHYNYTKIYYVLFTQQVFSLQSRAQ